jgi:putative ABC transport system permease protein
MKRPHHTLSLIGLVKRSLRFYRGGGLATAAGIAISTAILCGALIIGDSLRASLLQTVAQRLGHTTHTLTAGERIFSTGLATRINQQPNMTASAALRTEGVASVQGSELRINKVQVWGIDSLFHEVAGGDPFAIEGGEAVINRKLADRLQLEPGDYLLLRIRSTGPIPANTPFVSTSEQSVSRRLLVKEVAETSAGGDYHLQSVQSAPYNLFVPIDWLNRITGQQAAANMVLMRDAAGRDREAIDLLVAEAWEPEDGNLELNFLSDGRGWHLTSQRVFLDHHLSEVTSHQFPEAERHLTYFANTLKSAHGETPYAFVTAIERDIPPFNTLRHGQAIVSQWLADDLQLTVGDTMEMAYYQVGPLRELDETRTHFVVAHILPMEAVERDSLLMPHLPGLSDAGSCAGWDAGVPVDLERIRQKDEDYWDKYRGTPRLYIALDQGMELWTNRFGTLTSQTIPGGITLEQSLRRAISEAVQPAQIEFQVNPVMAQGITAARGGVDFSQLFAGLGLFIILAGLLLTGLLLHFSLKKREKEIILYAAMGFPRKLIMKVFLAESVTITLTGSLLGLLLSIGYSRWVFRALNHVWHDIVRTETLTLQFQPLVLALGLVASFLLGMVVVATGIRKRVAAHTKPGVQSATAPGSLRRHRRVTKYTLFSIVLLLPALGTAGYLLATQQYDAVLVWFVAGALLLPASLSALYAWLSHIPGKATPLTGAGSMTWKNIRRNPLRSFTIAALLALGTFVIMVTAANHRSPGNMNDPASGTGGFQWIAETTVPLLHDLNTPEMRSEYSLPDDLRFVPFFTVFDDDASCLNLNRVENPRIIATNPEWLNGRFSFASLTTHVDEQNPWQSLSDNPGGVIPAIADQSVIRWGLGLSVGDTLHYLNASGQEVKLLLVAGLQNSIFQGNVIIAQQHFLHHFPTAGGASLFLINTSTNHDTDQEALHETDHETVHITDQITDQITDHSTTAEHLEEAFRDHGWEMEPTTERLSRFQSVENTYLAIFFWMGALGMLLGTVGLAIFVAGTMVERRQETELLKTLGFPQKRVFRIYFTEYLTLLITGIIIGAVAALFATLPSLVTQSHLIAPINTILLPVILLLNGALWIAVIVKKV